jgi:ketosteroid isomerase-like protein
LYCALAQGEDMTVLEIGKRLVEIVEAGDPSVAWNELYSDEIVSVEASGEEMRTVQGKEAIMAKGQWFDQMFEVHSAKVLGPYPNGDSEFAIHLTYDVTHKESGNRFPINEVAVYEIADGKIVHEKFYYQDF